MSELHKTQCTVLLKAFHQCFHWLKLWATHHQNAALSLYFPNESGANTAALTCLCSAACLQCDWTEIAAFHYVTGQTCKKIKCKLKWSQTTFRLTCQQELEISFFWPLVVKVLILLQEKCADFFLPLKKGLCKHLFCWPETIMRQFYTDISLTVCFFVFLSFFVLNSR